MKALIVDDHTLMRKMVRAMLDANDTILEASNGKEALAHVQANPDIKLILTDFNMPTMNGLQLLETLRRDYPAMKPHVIFISSIRDKALVDKTTALGVSDWLPKPFKKEALTAILARIS